MLKVNHSGIRLVLACVLAVIAYAPSLNNSFIADDYVILKRIEILKTDPLYLYQVAPENFRSVSYVVFGTLKALAGYTSWPFYVFNIALHLANLLLLSRLLGMLSVDPEVAGTAVLLFAVFQAPQEAVMWLAAMNETTLFFFSVLTLLFWIRKLRLPAALTYSLALFSKESAVIIPVVAVLLDLYRERRFSWARYLWFAVPSLGFAGIFFVTVSGNFMLTNRSYAFGPQAVIVLAKTLHRLLWPWFYIILAAAFAKTAWSRQRIATAAALAGGVLVMMTPYMFIAYQTSLPSRQLYLASAVLMVLFAFVLQPLSGTLLHRLVLVAFLSFNVAYLWLRKDAQFEERAAPTTQLVQVLRQHSPQKALIRNFAYPLPEIASSAVLAATGWKPEMIAVGEIGDRCQDCLLLDWNAVEKRYDVSEIH